MKQINRIFLMGVLMLFGKVSAQEKVQSTGTYSLQQCIDVALQNHEQLKNAQLEYEISQAKVKQTIGIGLPQVSGKMDFMTNVEVQKQFVPANAFNPIASPNDVMPLGFGVLYSNNMNVTVSQMIFNGSYLVGLQAAKIYTELSQTSITKNKIDVAESVTKAYYSTLVAQERLHLLQINKEQLDLLYKDMKVMYENGLTDKLSLQRLNVSQNNLTTEIQKIENLVELSYQLLKYQMGVELNTQLTLSETLEGYTSKLENTQVQAANPTNRIEYRQLEVQKTLQELDLKNQKVQRYPTLVGFASMGYTIGGLQFNQITKVKDWEPYMIVGLSLNVPIFSGMQSHYQIQQSSLKVKQVENNFSVLKRGIEFETSQANKNYQNVLSTLDTHKANIELAKEVFENTQIKYKEGYASNLEVLQAESDLKQAQSNYLGAVYDALVAKVALEKALGNLYK